MNHLNNLILLHADQHNGIDRIQQGVGVVAGIIRDGKTHLGSTALYVAAAGAAIVVFASQLVQTWSEASLLVSLMVLWVAAFLLVASIANPLARALRSAPSDFNAWSKNRRKTARYEAMMALAANDSRLMADLRSAAGRNVA